ncbi:hypothetical protein GJAV_G00106970 [Gymnothorax javanicus]|nr:hypothetical protein GJAV_G00106970 [Gymnothorax javanicus]
MSFAENMESILSTYDDDDDIDFMSCDVCNVKIRSDSIYRIHLTTGTTSEGKARQQPPPPEWTNYMDYLDYLQLDEPIVGLKHLVEVDPPSGSPGPWYLCRLCHLDTDMPGITNHIIGRKHRQKYLETHRPDLVTWGKTNSSQPGKVVRAKAEVAERQDGRGVPEEQLPQQRGLSEREAPVALSGLPETFKRFLSGEKRRASRFTPATEPSREAGLDSKKRKLDASGLAEMVPLGSRGDLLDYLKNIDIESVEDANFIKEKLCHLLKEFQANKSERAKVRDYHHLSSQQHQPSADSTGPFIDSQDHQRGSHAHFQRGQMHEDHYNRIPEDLPDRFERGRRDPQDYIERGAMSSQDHFEFDPRDPQGDFMRDPAGRQDYFERDPRHSPDRYGRGLGDRYDPVPGRSRERSKEGHVDPRAAHDSYEDVWPPHRRTDMMRPTPEFETPGPPQQDSASLEKITSTLLQLVARKQRF